MNQRKELGGLIADTLRMLRGQARDEEDRMLRAELQYGPDPGKELRLEARPAHDLNFDGPVRLDGVPGSPQTVIVIDLT